MSSASLSGWVSRTTTQGGCAYLPHTLSERGFEACEVRMRRGSSSRITERQCTARTLNNSSGTRLMRAITDTKRPRLTDRRTYRTPKAVDARHHRQGDFRIEGMSDINGPHFSDGWHLEPCHAAFTRFLRVLRGKLLGGEPPGCGILRHVSITLGS